jgi:hypothetical protein
VSRKNKNAKPIIITAERLFELEKPRYNPHQTGCGAHGANKYDRNRKHKGKGWE